jgi:drug/metabolite transporter superfamily protein YnfA
MNSVRAVVERLTANTWGALAVLALAAFLEAGGDSFFQQGFYRSVGSRRVLELACGAVMLVSYGAVVNTPRWDFGRLLGVYVVFFFLVAQAINRVRFGQSPSLPVWTGGALIVAGGALMAFWRTA